MWEKNYNFHSNDLWYADIAGNEELLRIQFVNKPLSFDKNGIDRLINVLQAWIDGPEERKENS